MGRSFGDVSTVRRGVQACKIAGGCSPGSGLLGIVVRPNDTTQRPGRDVSGRLTRRSSGLFEYLLVLVLRLDKGVFEHVGVCI